MDPAERLLSWYADRARDLPWRRRPEAWSTWVSEVMLQQTRVDTVIPYFERFLARFPTPEALAEADPDEVLSLWSGLGYYSRARNLQRGAAMLARELGGRWPQTEEGLLALPGVGPYMAGAIGSIALGLDLVALDGNLERVYSRRFREGGGRKALLALARAELPAGRAGDFNQALMDLGATICTPRRPRCGECPLAESCSALAAAEVERWPPPRLRREPPRRTVVAAWIGLEPLLGRRPAEGLFGGLFELPGGELDEGEEPKQGLERLLLEKTGQGATIGQERGRFEHVLTHRRLLVIVLDAHLDGLPAGAFYTAWSIAGDAGIGISTLTRRALQLRPAPQLDLFRAGAGP